MRSLAGCLAIKYRLPLRRSPKSSIRAATAG
jgi:hypothetical protein